MTRSKSKKRSPTTVTVAKTPQTGEEYGRFTHAGLEWSPLLRIVGQAKPLQLTVAQWRAAQATAVGAEATLTPPTDPAIDPPMDSAGTMATRLAPPIVTTSTTMEDYAQIDLKLAIQATPILSEEVRVGTGYAGFTPTQRYHFLQWLEHVELAAPAAFRHLYLAHLETNLFDKPSQQRAAHQELCRLADTPAWQGEDLLWRTLLLSFQLMAQGEALSRWLPTAQALPTPLLGIALGQLALFGQPLTIEQLSSLLLRWQMAHRLPERSILQLRLDFLIDSLGTDPLAFLRARLDEAALRPTPWRTAHRDLRIQLVQPDLRQGLAPLLRDLSTMTEQMTETRSDRNENDNDASEAEEADLQTSEDGTAQDSSRQGSVPKPKKQWQLVLEFGDSRSEYFIFALNQAQRMPGYLQILDENRRMVHRIHFEKSEMRRFWSIWEYVQSWSTTQVYFNGKEVQKAYVYPYSPYLR